MCSPKTKGYFAQDGKSCLVKILFFFGVCFQFSHQVGIIAGTEERYLMTFSHKIQPVSFPFNVGDIKGPFDMCFGSVLA